MNRAIIEQGFPIPQRRGSATSRGEPVSITESLRACCVNCSFLLDDIRSEDVVRTTARRLGMRVRLQKTQEGLRVHRIE